jgi:hypothetical protein
VDLRHERQRAILLRALLTKPRQEPALDVAAIDGDVPLLRLGQLDVREGLVVERRDPTEMRPGAVADPDVGQLRRRRADEGGA